MSTRRKLQRQQKLANPPTQLPELVEPDLTLADGPACPGCGGDGDEEGPCGSCNRYFTTCWGTDPDAEEPQDDDEEPAKLHEVLSWDAFGRTREGDLCPACA